MNKKFKRAGATLALLLVGAAGAAGSLAYLTKNTGPVTNTFTATSGLVDATTDFKLKEKEVEYDPATSTYKFKTGGVDVEEITYDKLVPGVDVAKNPKVTISDLNAKSYLFIKVEDTTNGKITYNIDSTWRKVNNVANVYTLTDGALNELDKETNSNAEDYVKNILVGEKVTTSTTLAEGENAGTLIFKAYLVQAAGFETAEAAWTAANFTN